MSGLPGRPEVLNQRSAGPWCRSVQKSGDARGNYLVVCSSSKLCSFIKECKMCKHLKYVKIILTKTCFEKLNEKYFKRVILFLMS